MKSQLIVAINYSDPDPPRVSASKEGKPLSEELSSLSNISSGRFRLYS
jgi:hypothetical protein